MSVEGPAVAVYQEETGLVEAVLDQEAVAVVTQEVVVVTLVVVVVCLAAMCRWF